MSIRGLKQKTATALVAVMTASSVFTAFAGTVGTPSSSRSSIKVTFDAEGGYWLTDDVASDSEATPATPSRTAKDPVKTDKLIKTFKDLDSNDEGKFTTLAFGAEELGNDEWNDVKNDDAGKKYQWYYNDDEAGAVPVYDNTEIYSDVVLSAKWYDPTKVEVPETMEKEIGTPVATNLGDAKLVIEQVKEEDKLDHDALEAHAQVKAELEAANLELNKEIPLYPLEIKVEGNRGTTDPVTITMNLPKDFEDIAQAMAEDADSIEKIKVVHIESENKVEILPVDVRKDDLGNDGTWKMTFSTKSFSPFYIAVMKEVPQDEEMVTVKVRNVKNGYVAVWTNDSDEYSSVRKNLPIDKEVKIRKGTELYFDANGYWPRKSDKCGVFESLSLVDAKGNVIVENGKEQKFTGKLEPVFIHQDCEIVGEFSVGTKEVEEYTEDPFIIVLDPSNFGDKVTSYNGTPEVLQWNESKGYYDHFTGWTLRKPTEDELQGFEYYGDDWEFFDYQDGKVTSKKELEMGYYNLPFVINYQGKDYLWREDEEDGYKDPYAAGIDVGGNMELVYGYVMFEGEYYTSKRLGGRHMNSYEFAYADGDTWSKVGSQIDKRYVNMTMYGYEHKDRWQTAKGVEYKADTKLEPVYEDEYYFQAFALFEDEKGEVYKVDAIFDPELVGKTDEPNQPSRPGSSGGSGGGGSSSGSRSAGTNSYAMTGSWVGDAATGWKFLKSNGEYATNAWGWINGQYYYFDAAGNMTTGWQFINGHWYYLNPAEGSLQGAMLTGVIFDPVYNAYFYADASGAMVTGWYQVGANWYYFNPVSDGRQGALLADTYIDGYYVGADGAWVPAN